MRKLFPIGCEQAGYKVTASGMAAGSHLPTMTAAQKNGGVSHLLNNFRNRYVRTKIIACESHGASMRVGAGRYVAEQRRIERTPIPTMNKKNNRTVAIRRGPKQIDKLARSIAI